MADLKHYQIVSTGKPPGWYSSLGAFSFRSISASMETAEYFSISGFYFYVGDLHAE